MPQVRTERNVTGPAHARHPPPHFQFCCTKLAAHRQRSRITLSGPRVRDSDNSSPHRGRTLWTASRISSVASRTSMASTRGHFAQGPPFQP
jgi:hypothetical protein